jgi:hypothetical protein
MKRAFTRLFFRDYSWRIFLAMSQLVVENDLQNNTVYFLISWLSEGETTPKSCLESDYAALDCVVV